MPKNLLAILASVLVAATLVCAEEPAASPLVAKIKVQPDKAPDCSSLKSIVESVTRGCDGNDAKAVAIFNFMCLTFYHQPYASEPGGIPAIKVINDYGWGVCGGTHAVQSALWRQEGWGWRFVGWPGHTTVEAQYDGSWHYFDVFLRFYDWAPDGKGGHTVADEATLYKNKKTLIDDMFVTERGIGYFKTDAYEKVDGKYNWQARDILGCDAGWALAAAKDGNGFAFAVPKNRSYSGSPEGWAGYNHSDGNYSTDVNLAPGFALSNTWQAFPDAWIWGGKPGSYKFPHHSCGNHKDTRNNPGIGLVIEPYPDRSWGNGTLSFTPDFSSDVFLKSLVSSENVKYSDKALVPAEAGKPASVVFQLSSPYVMTKACGEAPGADAVEVSVDGGKTFKPAADLKNFDALVKGQLAAQVKVTFKEALKGLKFDATVQNNPFALPYLSPGKNVVAVSVADPKTLGDNKLVLTYAYHLGARTSSYEQLCEKKKRIALQVDAKWDDAVTYVQKVFTAKDLPATFEIDCPTPKGLYPVYPRMEFVRREVLAPDSKPLALPAGAVEAKPAAADELQTLPNPFLLGIKPPPAAAEAAPEKPAEKAPEAPAAK